MVSWSEVLSFARQYVGLPDCRLDAVAAAVDSDPELTALRTTVPRDDAESFSGLALLREKLGPLHMGFFVFPILEALPETCRFYQDHGIAAEILRETLLDIPRNMGEYAQLSGQFGIGGERYPWLWNHVEGRLFQLGRLQFVMHVLEADTVFGGATVPAGAKLLETHIPAGMPLTPDLCGASYQQARTFFAQTFGYAVEGFLCESWLLSPELGRLLPPESNILHFAREFTCADQMEEDDSVLQYVYGIRSAAPEQLPEATALQRELKRFFLNGGIFHAGYGFRPVRQ